MNFVSLFSGVGGFDLGLERAGMACAAQVEADPACRTVLARHWPDVPRCDDVCSFDARPFRGVDLVCGGWPCQDLSVAGDRAGLAGARSGLFHELVRVVGECAPRWVLCENVPGLLSSHKGRDMGAVIDALVQLGYGVAWRVLDAQHFGVPQRRRRIFLVGHRGEPWSAPAEVLFDAACCGGHPAPRRTAGTDAAGAVAFCADEPGDAVGRPLSTSNQRLDHETETFVAFHLTQDPITENDRTMALSAGNGTGCATLGVLGPQVRRLTPLECERLMGLPDDWTAGQADGTRYHQLGNAVVVPVVAWLGRRMAHTG